MATKHGNNNLEIVVTRQNSADLQKAILQHLHHTQVKPTPFATPNDWYMATAFAVRDQMLDHWLRAFYELTLAKDKLKVVSYLSSEFLLGPHLENNLVNLDLKGAAGKALAALGQDLGEILRQEVEPGLGNGGLGRLAACYLESMATLRVPAVGYGIRYEFGIFEQEIGNGWQVEKADNWLRWGNPWEVRRPDLAYEVKFGGKTEHVRDGDGRLAVHWLPDKVIKGMAYDTAIPGYRSGGISVLRLWKAEAVASFDFQLFNAGDYYKAVDEKVLSETITKILYPNDHPEIGKLLRLAQQYFFVSCSLQDMIQFHLLWGRDIRSFPETFAIQINDTHPAIGIAELMRLLVDEHRLDWDEAWAVTRRCFAYTNHTLLAEALDPAADLSEQISLAGKEASGTGNMKLALNGALTIGTRDGANVEIRDEVGAENFFLFGLDAAAVADLKAGGYNPHSWYAGNPQLRAAIDRIADGTFANGDRDLFRPLVENLLERDDYLLLADYQSYIDCQERVSEAFRNAKKWMEMSILNVARMGKFSSDRAIREYCEKIWQTAPIMDSGQYVYARDRGRGRNKVESA